MPLLPGDKLTAEALDLPLVVLRKSGLPGSPVTSGGSAVSWDVEDEDTTATWHSTVTNTSRITPDVAGSITFTATLHFVANATGRRGVGVRVNGTSVYYGQIIPASSGGTQGVTVTVTLEANGTTDYFECFGYQDSGAGLNLTDGNSTRFEARMCRRA